MDAMTAPFLAGQIDLELPKKLHILCHLLWRVLLDRGRNVEIVRARLILSRRRCRLFGRPALHAFLPLQTPALCRIVRHEAGRFSAGLLRWEAAGRKCCLYGFDRRLGGLCLLG